MLLAIDIGNSSTKFGVFDGESLVSKFAIPTKRDSTGDELKHTVGEKLKFAIKHAIACSVVPRAEAEIADLVKRSVGVDSVFVDNTFDFGLTIRYEPVESLGTDRLVNAFAAAETYGVPCIVCSFGTATTIDAVNSDREFLGGIIAPGMGLMAEALHLKTSKLPQVEIQRPESVIGNSTVASIQSGIFYGYIGLVEGIITRMKAELGETAAVIATGGFSSLIATETDAIDAVDENLTLEGLRLLHQKH